MKLLKTYFLPLLLLILLHFETYAQFYPSEEFTVPYKLNAPLSFNDTQEDSNVTLLGKFRWGPCSVVASKDNFLFVANGSLIQILDVTIPENPAFITEIDGEDLIRGIKIQSNYLYSLSPLMIVDISNPANPQIIYTGDFYGSEIILDGDYAYTSNFSEISILDISNHSQPQLLSKYYIPGWSDGMDIYNSQYLYSTTGEAWYIIIIDVTDKYNPQFAGTFGGTALNITIYDHYLFAPNFSIYDISNPTDPVYLGGIIIFAQISEIVVMDTLAYICGFEYGITVIDISDKSNPEFIYNLPWGGYPSGSLGPRDIEIKDNMLFASCWNGAWMLEIAAPNSLDSLSFYYTGNYCLDLVADDQYCYVASNFSGMLIFNYKYPSKPQLVSQFSTYGAAKGIILRNDIIFLNTNKDIIIIDITDKENPLQISRIPGNYYSPINYNSSMIVTDSLIISSYDSTYIRIIDYTDIYNPIIIKEFQIESIPED